MRDNNDNKGWDSPSHRNDRLSAKRPASGPHEVSYDRMVMDVHWLLSQPVRPDRIFGYYELGGVNSRWVGNRLYIPIPLAVKLILAGTAAEMVFEDTPGAQQHAEALAPYRRYLLEHREARVGDPDGWIGIGLGTTRVHLLTVVGR